MSNFFFPTLCFKSTDEDVIIRKFIRKNVKEGATIEEVDKKILEEFGEGSIGYLELDYWYYQYYNGKRGLRDKRSPDKKPLELLDLPNELIHTIISKFPLSARLDLPKVCTRFQCLTDTNFTKLTAKSKEGCLSLTLDENESDTISLPENIGYRRMKTALNNPLLKLEVLKIYHDPAVETDELVLKNMEAMLKSLDFQLHVGNFYLSKFHFRDLLSFLPYFKPGALVGANMLTPFFHEYNEPEPFVETMEKLQKLEQWNQMAMLGMRLDYQDTLNKFPINYFVHFKMINLSAPVRTNEQYDVFPWIRELVIQSPNLQVFMARVEMNFVEMCTQISPDIMIEWEENVDGVGTWTIPTSGKKFFVFRNHQSMIDLQTLCIQREDIF